VYLSRKWVKKKKNCQAYFVIYKPAITLSTQRHGFEVGVNFLAELKVELMEGFSGDHG